MAEVQKRFGVIGYPIKHSMSAFMHNAVFKELGLPYSYKKFEVAPEKLGEFVNGEGAKLDGFNATIPHKVALLKYMDEIDDLARLIGAVNTVKIWHEKMEDGNERIRKKGFNTDAIACIRVLKENGIDAKGLRVLLLGAGGAARGIAFQLALSGADLSIYNRTKERAEELIKEIKSKTGKEIKLIDDEKLKEEIGNSDLLINCTSVGMHPKVDEMPIPADYLHEKLVVMDIVYNPVKTKLLKTAEEKGCKTIDGVGMLVHQGAEALRIWLGIEPPIETMRKAVIENLRG